MGSNQLAWLAGGVITTEHHAHGELWLHRSDEPNTGWDFAAFDCGLSADAHMHLASWLHGRVFVIVNQVQLVS